MAKKKKVDRPIEVGDYVKVGLSGLGSDAYVVTEIHYKQLKNGETRLSNYTVQLTEDGTNGKYTHTIGEKGTMFVTGKAGYTPVNLKNRLTLL